MIVLRSNIAYVSLERLRTVLAMVDNGLIIFVSCDGKTIGNWH